jgi:hypothetical protein
MRYVTFFTSLSVLLSFQFLSAQAPDTLWTRTYEFGPADCVIETNDNNYAISIGSPSVTSLLKMNNLGDTLWKKTLLDTNTISGLFVRQTHDNGYLLAGRALTNFPDNDILIIRTNEFGDTLWTKKLGGSGDENISCMQSVNDGGFILIGTTTSFGAGNSDIWFIRTDLNGDTLWTKTYGDINSQSATYGIQTSDLGYLIVGRTDYIHDTYLFIIKTNSTGDTIWTKTYNNFWSGGSYACEVNDGYLISCIWWFICLMKTDFYGDSLWIKRLHEGIGSSDINYILPTFDENYLVGVNKREYYGLGGFDAEGYNILCTANGDSLWNKRIFIKSGGFLNSTSTFHTSDSFY